MRDTCGGNEQSSGWSFTRELTLFLKGLLLIAILSVAWAPPKSAHAQSSVYSAEEWTTIVAAAKKEGKVTLYSAQVNAIADRVTKAFSKAYPDIKIEWIRNTSGVLVSKVEQERAGGLDGADVFVTTEQLWLDKQASEGRLLKAKGPSARAWPADFGRDNAYFIGGIEPITIVYNTNLVPFPPQTYADLLKPEFKDKLGLLAISSSFVVAWYDWLEKTQGADYLVKYKAQNPKMYSATSTEVQGIAAGEIAAGIIGNISASKPLIEQGAPIKYVLTNPGLGVVYAMAALGWSKRPNAALVFLDFLMSPDGQTVWHGGGDSASPLPNIAGSLPVSASIPWDPTQYKPEFVKAYTERWNNIFR